MKHVVLIAVVCGAFAAAGVTLPVCEVAERAQRESAVYPGRVVPVAQVDVVPQVSGEILEVCFANGAEVKEGDVLYRIDRVKYEAAVKNAEAKVAECRAKASYAELSYARHMALVERRAVSQDEADNAQSPANPVCADRLCRTLLDASASMNTFHLSDSYSAEPYSTGNHVR